MIVIAAGASNTLIVFSLSRFRMLQVNIGKLAYPEYDIVTTRPLFKDKEAFDMYGVIPTAEKLSASPIHPPSMQLL